MYDFHKVNKNTTLEIDLTVFRKVSKISHKVNGFYCRVLDIFYHEVITSE